MPEAENLIDTLALERIEVNLFRGFDRDGRGRIFGGLVIAQALLAAYKTVEQRHCHSLHCYFIRPGDPSVPILYDVDRSRDGKTFTTRRVTAIQHGQQIFNLAASFQVPEEGLEHQDDMPVVPSPDEVQDEMTLRLEATKNLPPKMREMAQRPRPVELRPVNPGDFMGGKPLPPEQDVWIRATSAIAPDDVVMNQAVLAYASDMSFLSTSMRPHGMGWQTAGLQSASLDHTIWFHRHSHMRDWHLFAQRSPSASGARGFNQGEIFNQDGRLIASVAQEGLIRFRDPTQD